MEPPGAGSRRSAVGVVLFGVLAAVGVAVRVWQLTRSGDLATIFSGPGDFAPARIITALVHGRSVAVAYAQSGQPYPLPYLLGFTPFGFLDDP